LAESKPVRIPIRTPSPKSKPTNQTPTTADIAYLHNTLAARRIQRAYRTHLSHRRATSSKLSLLTTLSNTLSTLTKTHRQEVLTTPLKLSETGTVALGVKENMAFLSYEEQLVKLLIQADGIESEGVREVRDRRKEVIRRIQGELDAVDARRKEVRHGVNRVQEGVVDSQVVEKEDGTESREIAEEDRMDMDRDVDEAVLETVQDMFTEVNNVEHTTECQPQHEAEITEMNEDSQRGEQSADEWEVLGISEDATSESEEDITTATTCNQDFHESGPEPAPDIPESYTSHPNEASSTVNEPLDAIFSSNFTAEDTTNPDTTLVTSPPLDASPDAHSDPTQMSGELHDASEPREEVVNFMDGTEEGNAWLLYDIVTDESELSCGW